VDRISFYCCPTFDVVLYYLEHAEQHGKLDHKKTILLAPSQANEGMVGNNNTVFRKHCRVGSHVVNQQAKEPTREH